MSLPSSQLTYTQHNPYFARLTENRLLNKPGSSKETRHFVVATAGSGLAYAAGDSLGVLPENDPALVAEVLQRLGATGSEAIVLPRETEAVSLYDALLKRLSLTTIAKRNLELAAMRATEAGEKKRLQDLLAPESAAELAAFLGTREVVDLLAGFPSARPSLQEFVAELRRLVPRLYSIASSPLVHPDEVHLTIAVVRYETHGRKRAGVCSTYLADRVREGVTPVPVFVARSHFRPPEDDAVDAIMIGPGTGIAPFRAFLQERGARRAAGRNWLFVGDQHRATDFLYEDEFDAMQKAGVLHRLDTAFSRDQAGKIYVQDRLRERGDEIWTWLEGGACFYVCGDAKRMAKDVDAVLHEIVASHGNMSAEAAAAYIQGLKKVRRYQRDVY